jgi:hypothetical protein
MTAGKTVPELTSETPPIVGTDELVVYRAPGPLKRAQASVFGTYVNTVIGTAFTRTLLDDADAVTARTTLAAVGTAALASSTGGTLIGILRAGTGAIAETLSSWIANKPLDATSFGVVSDGTTDDGPALRLALAAGIAIGRAVELPKKTTPIVVSYDPASSLGGGLYGYSILVPTGTRLITNGATIKAANGITSWNRVVSFQGQSNIDIQGVLRVDANAANRGTPVNEHMHGVFFFNSTDIRIPDGIDSQNAVGDNVYVGGTDNTVGSTRCFIGDVYCKTAGRKNFVVQCSRAFVVGNCIFDNISGGSAVGGAADGTECHSLDVESDTFTGATPNDIAFGNIVTYGSGNDFTAGVTAVCADNWTITINSMLAYVTPKAGVKAWEQNGITIKVNNLTMTGLDLVDETVALRHAARLVAGSVTLSGSSGGAANKMLSITAVGSNIPRVDIATLKIDCSLGYGAWIQSSLTKIGHFYAKCPTLQAFWLRGNQNSNLIRTSLTIDTFECENTGAAGASQSCWVVTTVGDGDVPRLTIKHEIVRDSRASGSQPTYVGWVANGCAAGASLGTIDNPNPHVRVNLPGSDKYFLSFGAGGFPAAYVCTGTPEAMIPAPIGSIAQRTDGGAATSFYVKESGTGNTGWVAK